MKTNAFVSETIATIAINVPNSVHNYGYEIGEIIWSENETHSGMNETHSENEAHSG